MFKKIFFTGILSIMLIFVLAACKNSSDSVIVYDDDVLSNGYINEVYEATVATATGAENIEYALKSGSSLPQGLSLNANGDVEGTPIEVVDNHTFTIIASANRAVSAEATFTITILNQNASDVIVYAGSNLEEGYVDAPYSVNVATATGSNGVVYVIKTGDDLPTGLELSQTGIISGTPTEEVTDYSFVIVADSESADPVEATFNITINPASGNEPDIIVYTASQLSDGQVGTTYQANIANATGATNILYGLKSGSVLPSGLTLSTSGVISGIPTTPVSGYSFVVVATANNAISAEATFTITISRAPATFVFETEYTNIDNLEGGGISGAPSTPYDMVLTSPEASNGYFLGFTHRTNLTVTYLFTSDINATGTLTLRLGSEIGPMIINPTILEVKVNGVAISYSQFTIPENVGYSQEFHDFEINTNVALVDGDNIITITILENDYLNGTTGAPMYDNISIHTTANLTWVPKTSNIE
jgi:hypothetical protein